MKTTRIKLTLWWVAFGNVAGVVRGAGLGPEDAVSVSAITGGAAIVFSAAIVGVFALELLAARRERRAARVHECMAKKTYRPLFVVEDDDGRTRVFERA